MKNCDPVLQVYQLTVNYEKTPVLWDITLNIPAGKIVGILGPNGAGKSTFIKSVLGLVKPLSGKIKFFGQSLKTCRQRVAYIPQRQSVDWDFPITVKDLVLMGRYGRLGLFRWPSKGDLNAAELCLEKLGLLEFADRQISQLSGGQQQRAFIARALLQEADVYFMDEPFAGIDLGSEALIMNILRELRDQGKTVFVVNHDLHNVESYFDWTILLNRHLIGCGTVQQTYNSRNLDLTFGKNYTLFSDGLKVTRNNLTGLA